LENTTAEYYTTIISLGESPLRPGQIWAGSDDGNLQVTQDGGKSWTNLTKNVPKLPANSPVSHVEPSRVNENSAYVSFERHMFDDFRPYVFKTTDGGRNWTNISGNLPEKAYVQIVREDPKNTSLLYAGTELGLYASYNGGKVWVPLNLKNLPNVAVHDIFIHPRENDLILATHGRSIWIFDDATPIQQMSDAVLASDAHLFDVRAASRFTTRFTRYGIGDKVFAGPNPPSGAVITYYLKNKVDEKTAVKIQVLDGGGKVVRELNQVPKEKGFNRATWDLRYTGPKLRRQPPPDAPPFFANPIGPQVLPGAYTIKLTVGDKSFEKRVEVKMDPTVTVSASDIQTAHDMTIKLRDMQSTTNETLRTLDSLKEQIEQIEKTVKDRMPDAPKELTDALAENKKQVDSLLSALARPQTQSLGFSGSSQLAERLQGLLFTIDGTNAAPTNPQKTHFTELQTEFNQKIPEATRYISQGVPQLNEKLRKHNAPTVIAGKPVEMPK
jgi:hypothetical protein